MSARQPLAAVKVTKRYPSFRSGRLETWEAETTDGLWAIVRIEDTGTPWEVIHRPTRQPVPALYGTLRSARLSIASGDAERMLIAYAVTSLLGGRW